MGVPSRSDRFLHTSGTGEGQCRFPSSERSKRKGTMKKISALAICVLLGSSMMFAQGKRIPSGPGGAAKSGGAAQKAGVKNYSYSGCDGTSPAVVGDGSLVEDYVIAGSWAVYAVGVEPGHSYTAEVWNPFGQDFTYANGRPFLGAADSTCAYVPYTDVSSWDPALTRGFSARVSWIPASDPNAYVGLCRISILRTATTITSESLTPPCITRAGAPGRVSSLNTPL